MSGAHSSEDRRYEYGLLEELIARHPAAERDASRLMGVDPASERIDDLGLFRELPRHLRPGDLLVVNDTRVFHARLRGRRRSGGAVEAVLLSRLGPVVPALVRPLTKLKLGEEILFGPVAAKLGRRLESGPVELDFGGVELGAFLERYGEPPIPPYLKRASEPDDEARYQTVYASAADREGAVAAPTAGFHFTAELLDRVRVAGAEIARLTLNVGYGTFAPVTPGQATMHAERYEIPEETIRAIESRRGRLIAVGTTVIRALEAWRATGESRSTTEIFIRRGHAFRSADALITNFHLPGSSLLMLVHAFAGDIVFEAYRRAVADRWRFFSYGDAMFITSRS